MTRYSLVLGSALVVYGCADRSSRIPADLMGSWRTPSGHATLQFLPNQQAGIRVTTPNVDRTTWYSWELVAADRVRLKPVAQTIRPSGDLPSGAVFRFTVVGDALTLTGEDGESLKYTKVID